jgi:Uncharacterized protein containing caspase domain
MRMTRCIAAAFVAVSLAATLGLASCSQVQGSSATTVSTNRYALIYGISDYPGSAHDLTYPTYDAASMSSLLSGQNWTVTTRKDSSATSAAIAADFASLSSISSDSTVLLYYSGHGMLGEDGETAYIIPYDSLSVSTTTNWRGQSSESYSFDYSKMISPSTLSTLIGSLPTKNVIVIFDSCYSGDFVATGSSIDASPQDYSRMESYSAFSTALTNFGSLLVANAKASGAKTPIVISAAGSDEYSWDGTSSMGHGVFTYYLLESASKADSDGDGFVTTTEAYQYTATKIKTFDINNINAGYTPFLPHISGNTRDLVLFTK